MKEKIKKYFKDKKDKDPDYFPSFEDVAFIVAKCVKEGFDEEEVIQTCVSIYQEYVRSVSQEKVAEITNQVLAIN